MSFPKRISFRDFPLRQKLIWLMLGNSALALVLACGAFLAFEIVNFRRAMPNQLGIIAQIIGDNARSPLGFNDRQFANNTLLPSLVANPHVKRAVIYDSTGEIFAQYHPSGNDLKIPMPKGRPGYWFDRNYLHICHPIKDGTEIVGMLYLQSDLQELDDRILVYCGIGISVLVLALLGSAALALRLQHLISRPVLELASAAQKVALEKDYSLRARKFSQDELGGLTDSFNQMLAQIQQQAKEITQASRFAGMAEVATGILHNVGNVLNSLNLSATVVSDRLLQSKVKGLTFATKLLSEHQEDLGNYVTSDSKGRLIPKFLLDLTAEINEERTENMKELHSLVRNVEHIKQIVAMQQTYARVSDVTEPINPIELIEDAVRITSESLNQWAVRLVRHYEEVPQIWGDKHKVLQILVNLLSNACHALEKTQNQNREVTLSLRKIPSGLVAISVGDSGTGIAPDNLAKVFNHGFTTRKKGHGFGLHSGANSAHEMGGSLRAESEGIGQGATFTLELPIKAKRRARSSEDFQVDDKL